MRRLVAATTLALAACSGGEERLDQAPVPAVSGDAGATTAPPPPSVQPIPGRVKRTVMERSPFGGTPGNLLADGDFELSTVQSPGAQLGWRAYDASGSGELESHWETGGLCRSGLHCAVFEPSTLLFGRGTSAWQKGNVASVWVKIPFGARCSMVRPILVSCDTFAVGKLLAAGKPDKDGWCHYTSTLAQQDEATCMYLDNTLTPATWALVDDALIGPDDGTILPQEAEFWVPDAVVTARLANLRELVLSTMPLGRAARRVRPAR